ncbi:esterase-like activity of phytase family protein [Aphanothece sacrum]|uniref:3-octaprenyl-4-hydroxybenzoate carboxy-lyase n=1 Tax=Aphanothece sacrum FPU1 TaxID=1920663 RepID=A0A401ILN7_APHSA|nr:esterase-like activity of phytase family protein [Aphanothece sacrum]GBF82151.1 3-octaprenyl-4-hydroxybenzoate carboxy-lyase [Aphanothece sacrum FPU1]GBF86312.1 3-octaprenyl-4-hydroxybenzoate carboxy-lyase [Aphanothece sacrum FPU3]
MPIKPLFPLLWSSLILSSLIPNAAQAVSLVNTIVIPGDTTDLSGQPTGANGNRLGGFFSDLYYDRSSNFYYGLSDRGPGGGVLSYDTRVQKFTLNVNPNTGAISNFNLVDTILFTKDGQNFNGLNPRLLNGNSANLGLSFDSEGFVVASNGNFYVSDEYGPSVYEFNPQGSFIRAFNTPNANANTNPINLIPKQSNGTTNYVDGRVTNSNPNGVSNGRQDNRGFEGLAITPDGTKLFAMLQDPLVNEGQNPGNSNNDGRYSRNLRIVQFDTATGNSTAQYIYQLDDIAALNVGNSSPFDANQQGRSIGISAITAINNNEFLIIERDNRGIGVDAPASPTVAGVANNPVASKRVYKIDLTGATDVSNTSLTGTNNLGGITPVAKTLFLDIQSQLQNAGQVIPEKIEGLTIGPKLNDGSYTILLGSDNDYSVTQDNPNGIQTNVCTNLIDNADRQVALNANCPSGLVLIPTYLYSFKGDVSNFVPRQTVPEPSAIIGLISLGLGGLSLKRRR